jgi:hypothetical protein
LGKILALLTKKGLVQANIRTCSVRVQSFKF